MGFHIVCLGGEADDEFGPAWAWRGHRGENVGIFREVYGGGDGACSLLDFRVRTGGGTPIGDGGDADEHIGGQGGFAGGEHVARASDAADVHTWGRIERHRTGDKRHVRAGLGAGAGDGVTLLAARAVGYEAHRIDRLNGWACGN